MNDNAELVQAVAAREPWAADLDDQAIRQRFQRWRDLRQDRLEEPQRIDAFALVREAARRALGQRLYDVQIAGGLALYDGAVIEMATGEGKTLTAVAPVALQALAGRGAHVLTFNDYLARRDADWMGPVYRRLGLAVDRIQEGMGAERRRRAYAAHVTYLTAREAGFDYLRDGLALEPGERVRRPFRFALVDEADSILIDEARVPMVLAGAGGTRPAELARLAQLVEQLRPGTDYETDPERRNVFLTEAGADRMERLLGIDSLVAPENQRLAVAVAHALHAWALLRRDVDYIVRRQTVELVDEFTGRVAERRQWPDGLQAAVEAKEGLRPGGDRAILGSITLQHFLRLYPRLAGMTATAGGAAEELLELFGLPVVAIPSHRPSIRIDQPDRVYSDRPARDRALIAEIAAAHADGRPILVGTASVAESERLAAALAERDIDCQVLNAKNDELEAAVVAEAGAFGAVTISTNMAGRGTDIRLGGADGCDRARVAALGGLYVLGTHRHESRRIDRQLRGRAGRQGDPGSSRFFLSLEDDLLQRCGIQRLIPRRLLPEQSDSPIESRVVRREVARAQRIAEGQSLEARRRLYAYSRILERQRLYLRDWRRQVLEGAAPRRPLAERRPGRWHELAERLPPDQLDQVERRLTLLAIDRCWSEYLAEMQTQRDEVHLATLDGREPLAEFYKIAIRGFDRLLERIDQRTLDAFDGLKVRGGRIDWQAHGLAAPAATWTYLVSDQVFDDNIMRQLAHRPAIGLWGVLLLWWVLIPWGLWQRWKRRRSERAG